jgi:hypothetical protein
MSSNWPGGSVPTVSGDQLIAALVLSGGKVVSRQARGTFVNVERRLVFVRHAAALHAAELADLLHLAGIAPGTLTELLGGGS